MRRSNELDDWRLRPAHYVAIAFGAAITATAFFAWKYATHETFVLAGGAAVVSLLTTIGHLLHRNARRKVQTIADNMRASWERELAAQLDWVRAFLISGTWNEVASHVHLVVALFSPSPLGAILVSAVVDPQSGMIAPVRLRLEVANQVVFLVEAQGATSLVLKPRGQDTRYSFESTGALPALPLTSETRVATGQISIAIADNDVGCAGPIQLVRAAPTPPNGGSHG